MRLLAILLFIPSVCLADPWTNSDTAWQAGYLSLLAVDCAQTRDMRPQFEERNTILGKHPSRGEIDNLCLATALGHTAISYFLPQPYRRYFQIGTIVIEAVVVEHGYKVGLKLAW